MKFLIVVMLTLVGSILAPGVFLLTAADWATMLSAPASVDWWRVLIILTNVAYSSPWSG